MEKYEKLRVVGRGAFGTVYLCRRKHDNKQVIVKQIPVDMMTAEERQASMNEVRVLEMLNHPNIIEHYDNFLEEQAIMIVMEYAPGGTLYDFLLSRGNSLLDEEEIVKFFVQILLSLHHIHSKNILHRDIKTQNIFLSKDLSIVKIGDFGISKVLSSKSKAHTVVGTPSYISPELCEGKPYNQKSDVWALGCILYELCTLKRAFEAANLPAIVLKIMRGNFAPVSDRYSHDLRNLISLMLNLDPTSRPSVRQILAQPVVAISLYPTIVTIGAINIGANLTRSQTVSEKAHSTSASMKLETLSSARDKSSVSPLRQAGAVMFWGGGTTEPTKLQLSNADCKVIQVAVGRTQKCGVTTSGKLIVWESVIDSDATLRLPGMVDSFPSKTYIPRYLEGQSGVTITQVTCGDLFIACITERGILMTFGSGASGCLGHGNLNDMKQAKIVEGLLGYEVVQVSAGSSHIMALTSDREVFIWGRGENGRLGLEDCDFVSTPELLPLNSEYQISSVHCGIDASILLTNNGKVIGFGSNMYNKLCLDDSHQVHEVNCPTQVSSSVISELNIVDCSLGHSHCAFLTDDGVLYTVGSNRFNQLGLSNAIDRIPIRIYSLPRVQYVACGDAFTVVSTEDGKIYSWGKSTRGRLGRQNFADTSPQEVTFEGSGSVKSLHSCHGNTIVSLEF